MKRKRFTEEQIIRILGEAESGTGILELCRKHGMANTTLYKWRRKYGGMEISDARRLKQLEDENHYLKRLAADQALDIQMEDVKKLVETVMSDSWSFPDSRP